MNVVGRNVDHLEENITRAERELDPSKLRKVFSSLSGLVSCPYKSSTNGPVRIFLLM